MEIKWYCREYRQVTVTRGKLPSRVAAALAWRGALSSSPFLKSEVLIIIRLFISIIIYINYNIIEIEIEALIIYINYINYVNIYKGVRGGGSYKLSSVLSMDSRNYWQLYQYKH